MNPTTLFPSLWHRRAASVIMMTAIVALALLLYTYLSNGQHSGVVLYEAIGATVGGLILASLARMPVPEKFASWCSFLGFAFTVSATGFALMSTSSDSIHVIYVLVFSLLSIIAGLYGPLAWLILVGVVSPYVSIHFTGNDTRTITSDIAFVLFYILPIIASWLLWHGGPRRAAGSSTPKDHTFSSLAEQLNQVSNESEIVISTIADGVVALSQKGEVQLINPAAQKMLGWNKHDSLGLDYRSIIKLQDKQGNTLDENFNPIKISLHNVQSIERSDLSLQTSSGKLFQARLTVTPIGASGDGVIVVFRDITTEKAEEREQAEFISTASHEMRTPVATIEGYLGLALNPNTAQIDDKAKMFLMKAHESAQHLGRLFQDLLDVSKADDGRLRNMPTVTDLVAFCGDIVNGLQTKANEKGLTLGFAPLADMSITERKLTPVFYTDVDNDHLREVMNNLIENAIKYTKAGTVTVNVTGDNDSCIITVKDSGIGIPREDLPHLFQKFYRVDSSDTREIGGTGLGLYLCRRLVELIGGKIWVESDYGHGSVFTVSLPRLGFEEATSRLQAIKEQRLRQNENEKSKGEVEVPAVASIPVVSPLPAAAPAPVVTPVVAPAPTPPVAAAPAPTPPAAAVATPKPTPLPTPAAIAPHIVVPPRPEATPVVVPAVAVAPQPVSPAPAATPAEVPVSEFAMPAEVGQQNTAEPHA